MSCIILVDSFPLTDDSPALSFQLKNARGDECTLLLSGGELMEVNLVKPKTKTSFFLDETTREDGSFLVASKMDPLFLALPYLIGCKSHFSPMTQVLTSGDASRDFLRLMSCKGLSRERLELVADVDDRLGSPMYRFNESKALEWLKAKAHAAADAIAGDAVTRAGVGAVTFDVEDATGADGSGKGSGDGEGEGSSSSRSIGEAVELIGDYLSEEWAGKLASFMGVDGVATTGSSASTLSAGTSATGKRKWNVKDSQEAALSIAFTTNNMNKRTKTDGGEKVKSAAAKKLAKINTKGMRSLASFFSKK